MNEKRRFIVSVIALIALLVNILLFIKLERLKHSIKIENLVKINDKKFKFEKGIYFIYPLNGETCSSCMFTLIQDMFNKFNEKVFILLPEHIKLPEKVKKEFERAGRFVFYKSINSILKDKVLFISGKGEILFCIDIAMLSGSPHKNLKSFIYFFKFMR